MCAAWIGTCRREVPASPDEWPFGRVCLRWARSTPRLRRFGRPKGRLPAGPPCRRGAAGGGRRRTACISPSWLPSRRRSRWRRSGDCCDVRLRAARWAHGLDVRRVESPVQPAVAPEDALAYPEPRGRDPSHSVVVRGCGSQWLGPGPRTRFAVDRSSSRERPPRSAEMPSPDSARVHDGSDPR